MKVLTIAAVTTSVLSLLAASPAPHLPTSAKPAASGAPVSKYQQAKLENFRNSAPADQYFGRMKLSYLGINNTFRDASITAGDHTVDPAIVNKVELADDALRDWANHFPRDPQLARTYYLAVDIQRKIWLKPNQDEAWTYINRLTTGFPTSYFGKILKKAMDRGFTEHYYAEAVPCTTATPTAMPTETPAPIRTQTPAPHRAGRPTPTPTPTPSPTPSPEVTPSPSPTPVPTPREIAKGLKVMIETPACVPPATPSPSPPPTATPSPEPVPSGAILSPQPAVSPRSAVSPQPAVSPSILPR